MKTSTLPAPRRACSDDIPAARQRRGSLPGWIGFALLTLLLVAGTARAGSVQGTAEVSAPSLLYRAGDELVEAPRLDTDVEMSVSGLVARVAVRQSFRNDSSEYVEGLYVFPLPENAAVDRLRMRIGTREIVGEIRTRDEARKVYTKARDSGRKASLIEQQRANVFTNAVANIGPGETVVIDIEYQQRVDVDDNRFSLRLPLAIMPRFDPGPTLQADNRRNDFGGASVQRVSRPMSAGLGDATGGIGRLDAGLDEGPLLHPAPQPCGAGGCPTVSIRVLLDAGFPLAAVRSPSHDVASLAHARGQEITLRQRRVPMDRDFVLWWRPVIGTEPGAAVFTDTVGDDRYALLMIVPPHQRQGLSVSRELILVIDRSGSMGGASIRQARAALVTTLDRLQPGDRFNVIAFDDQAQALFAQPEPADRLALQTAQQFVNSLDADGGTNIDAALELALDAGQSQRAASEGLIRQVVFITDGAVGREEQLHARIARELGDSRLFTVGIGAAPNGAFMRRAARLGRGSFTSIASVDDVGDKMAALLTKLENPALTGIRIDWPAGAEVIAQPDPVPDLFYGEPLVVTAKLPSSVNTLTVHGAHGWRQSLDLSGEGSAPGVAALFARERIDMLLDARLFARDRKAIEQQVTRLALKHELVSPFTSLVAVERQPTRPSGSPLGSAAVPGALPVTAPSAQTSGYPVGATDARLWVLFGLVLMLFPFLLHTGWRQ